MAWGSPGQAPRVAPRVGFEGRAQGQVALGRQGKGLGSRGQALGWGAEAPVRRIRHRVPLPRPSPACAFLVGSRCRCRKTSESSNMTAKLSDLDVSKLTAVLADVPMKVLQDTVLWRMESRRSHHQCTTVNDARGQVLVHPLLLLKPEQTLLPHRSFHMP